MSIESNDRHALTVLRQYLEARNEIRSVREEQSARASKVHADRRDGLIDAAVVGQAVMEAAEYGEDQIIATQVRMDAAMDLLNAWHRGERIILEKLSS
ncbi:hypothetical protein ACA106_16660 [Agrobacterium pusense]|uniref:hypothetical protein n=1 Tax=Agrobacterium pusense TaxID=648995 RepID=UPI0035A6B263